MGATDLRKRLLNRVVRAKGLLPAPVRKAVERVGRNPNTWIFRAVLRFSGYRSHPAPSPTRLPVAKTRVYIAPANYAGQGYLWARSLQQYVPDTGACNMSVEAPGGFGFQSDSSVPAGVYHLNREWQRAEFQRVTEFSHVLIEAERPLFGREFGYRVEDEIAALRDAGVSVALITHGSDTRNPAAHRELTKWSPFHDDVSDVAILQDLSDKNRALIANSSLPAFVPTPELLHDLPGAFWCPIVVEQEKWQAASRELLSAEKVQVTHIPSRGWLKGTQLIEPSMQILADEGLLEYRHLSGVPFDEMPNALGGADIVLEQFRLGIYATTAIEAMAAGRVVVAHVLPSVRDHIREISGFELPIVEATPESLETELRKLIADPERMRSIGRQSQTFAAQVHDGRLSARVLRDHWLSAPQ